MISALLRRLVVLGLSVAIVTLAVSILGSLQGVWPALAVDVHGATFDLSALQRRTWLPISSAATALGLFGAILSVWPRTSRRASTIRLPSSLYADGLNIHVSRSTLVSLIRFEARRVEGVRGITPTVTDSDDGWRVHCDLVVWRGLSMREVSEQVTERIREALHRHTGVNLSTLEIDVSLAAEPTARVE